MQLQMKIFLYCLSVVFIREVTTAQVPPVNKPSVSTTDISIKDCDSKTITLVANKVGFYYKCDDNDKLKKCTLMYGGKTQPNKQFDMKLKAKSATLLRFDSQWTNFITGEYDKYKIDCLSTMKVHASGSMVVKKKEKDSTVKKIINEYVDMEFAPSSVQLGDKVTLTLKEKSKNPDKLEIDQIEVRKCTVQGKGSANATFYEKNKNKEIQTTPTNGKTASLSFNAFRLPGQEDDSIKFDCVAAICHGKNCILPPSPVHPIIYDAPQRTEHNVIGFLSVHIPQYADSNIIPNSAEKVSWLSWQDTKYTRMK